VASPRTAVSISDGLRRAISRLGVFYAIVVPLLLISAVAAIATGSTHISWSTIVRVLSMKLLPTGWVGSAGLQPSDVVIIWLIRLPRVLVAALVGAALATGGVVMQGLFRNPLAEPGLIGAGSGAVLGAVIAFVAGWNARSVMMLPLLAMLGALAALTAVYMMATRGGVTPVSTLLLAGVATGSLLSSLSSLLLSLNLLDWEISQEIVFWMMGGLDVRTWTHVWICAPFVAVGLLAAMAQSRELDLLQQGEESAASLGVEIQSSKRLLMLTSAILTGAAIAVAGMVGFVGLIVPHAVRMIVGPSNRTLLPASAVFGAMFLILADLLARTIHPPTEIRLGVITALCGGPFFIALLMRRYREAGAE
jgi:iron complex transport system permease protein